MWCTHAKPTAFRAVNDLPSGLHRPVYVVMQAGSLAAVYVTAGLAATRGKRALAGTIAVSGTSVWAGCKLVKRWVGRGRPAAHVDDVTIRGNEESGLGFPSGHAAVATTLAVIVAGEAPGRGEAGALRHRGSRCDGAPCTSAPTSHSTSWVESRSGSRAVR